MHILRPSRLSRFVGTIVARSSGRVGLILQGHETAASPLSKHPADHPKRKALT
jgi:hypothetical protein